MQYAHVRILEAQVHTGGHTVYMGMWSSQSKKLESEPENKDATLLLRQTAVLHNHG